MRPRIVTLCTGNVMRSAVLAVMITRLAGDRFEVRSAGTHAVEGKSIGPRTLAALAAVDATGDDIRAHRSHQLTDDDVAWADLILTAEADHVAYVRARYPEAGTAVQVGLFCRVAPLDAPFAEQVRVATAARPDDTLDVPDPGELDQAAYDECVRTLIDLAEVFTTVAGGPDQT